MEWVGRFCENEKTVGDMLRDSLLVCEYDRRGDPVTFDTAYARNLASGFSAPSSLDDMDDSLADRRDFDLAAVPSGLGVASIFVGLSVRYCSRGSSGTGDGARLGSVLLPVGVRSLYSLSSSSSNADIRPRLDLLPLDLRLRLLCSEDLAGGG